MKMGMNLIFLGAPGVGKGTYALRIGPRLGIAHISTGDLLREQVARSTRLGKEAKKYMDGGELVPDDVVIGMLKDRIKEKDCRKGFILDGFPRTIPQAESLEKMVRIDKVFNITLDREVLVKKISARRICSKCGDIYNLAYIKKGKLDMPPMLPKVKGKCDKCGGPLIHRSDDRPGVVRERLREYEKQTAPLIDYYRKKRMLADVEVEGGPDVMVPVILKLIKKS